VGAGSLDSSSEVRDSAVGLQDRAYGVLLRRLLGTERDRVSVVTSTRVGGSAVVEVHLMSAAVSPLVAMEATTPAAEIATCSAIATIVRRPFEGLRDTTSKTRLTGGRAGAIELLRFVLSDEILNATALGQRVFASTEGAVCVIVGAGSADCCRYQRSQRR
jgi:hypothetical protein